VREFAKVFTRMPNQATKRAARDADQRKQQDRDDLQAPEALDEPEVRDQDDGDEALEHQDVPALRAQVRLARLVDELGDRAHLRVHGEIGDLPHDGEAEQDPDDAHDQADREHRGPCQSAGESHGLLVEPRQGNAGFAPSSVALCQQPEQLVDHGTNLRGAMGAPHSLSAKDRRAYPVSGRECERAPRGLQRAWFRNAWVKTVDFALNARVAPLASPRCGTTDSELCAPSR
jgi:hypothetical protein